MYKNEVAKGIALIEEHDPGWRARIDRETLDLRNPHHCILAQVFGGYTVGLDKLGILATDNEHEYGFELAEPQEEDTPERFKALTQAWLAAL